jgi:hypothetical protein
MQWVTHPRMDPDFANAWPSMILMIRMKRHVRDERHHRGGDIERKRYDRIRIPGQRPSR